MTVFKKEKLRRKKLKKRPTWSLVNVVPGGIARQYKEHPLISISGDTEQKGQELFSAAILKRRCSCTGDYSHLWPSRNFIQKQEPRHFGTNVDVGTHLRYALDVTPQFRSRRDVLDGDRRSRRGQRQVALSWTGLVDTWDRQIDKK